MGWSIVQTKSGKYLNPIYTTQLDINFYRYFTCGEDIGSWDVLRLAAEQAELDGDRMVRAVESGRYDARLDEAHQLGSAFGVDGTPTFIINRRYKIVGAQPYELIFKALRQVLESSS